MALYFDVVENPRDSSSPEMVWEYFNGDWREFAVEDETRNLRVPGIFSFIGAADSEAMARFGVEQHWIRGRLKQNGLPGEPTINNIYLNAVWASQQRTVRASTWGQVPALLNQVSTSHRRLCSPRNELKYRNSAGSAPMSNGQFWQWRLAKKFQNGPGHRRNAGARRDATRRRPR